MPLAARHAERTELSLKELLALPPPGSPTNTATTSIDIEQTRTHEKPAVTTRSTSNSDGQNACQPEMSCVARCASVWPPADCIEVRLSPCAYILCVADQPCRANVGREESYPDLRAASQTRNKAWASMPHSSKKYYRSLERDAAEVLQYIITPMHAIASRDLPHVFPSRQIAAYPHSREQTQFEAGLLLAHACAFTAVSMCSGALRLQRTRFQGLGSHRSHCGLAGSGSPART